MKKLKSSYNPFQSLLYQRTPNLFANFSLKISQFYDSVIEIMRPPLAPRWLSCSWLLRNEISLLKSCYILTENCGIAEVSVLRTHNTRGLSKVKWHTEDDTAIASKDYEEAEVSKEEIEQLEILFIYLNHSNFLAFFFFWWTPYSWSTVSQDYCEMYEGLLQLDTKTNFRICL